MFLKRDPILDLSSELRELQDWKPGSLRVFEYALNVTALAIEPVSGLLAAGTGNGVIHLIGRPGVECKILLPDAYRVTSLYLPTSAFKIVCLDDHNQLHVWDLMSPGVPKYLASARFDQANSLSVSSYHTHALVVLQSGEIRTYDMTCLRKSPYTIPNLWSLYEDKMAASGMPEVITPTSGVALDVAPHPRNMNFLFIIYGGGIVLSDLTERNTSRVYELVHPPGAPGGNGYGSPDILTHRRPEATCIAIHPAGHFFAVGYTDGSIAFWAVDDEDQPLLVRTLDDLDVNVVDAAQLEIHLNHESSGQVPPQREPIFKLSWCSFSNSSDPRGGDTALVVLGGSQIANSPGVTVMLLPAFNPSAPPTSPIPTDLHPATREAMRSSVHSSDVYFYSTNGLVQDYLLIPRSEPHFSGNFDPFAILFIREGPRQTRVVEGYQFPPPSFSRTAVEGESSTRPQDALDDLADTLKYMQMSDEPRTLHLPGILSNGSSGILDGQLKRVNRDSFLNLVQGSFDNTRSLNLRAGFAYLNTRDQSEAGLSKYQPPRILITAHSDLTIQISDVSANLLTNAKPNPIEYEYPNPLYNLSIDVNIVLSDARVAQRLGLSDCPMVHLVEMASDSLEIAVGLSGGAILMYCLRKSEGDEGRPYHELSDGELMSLQHIHVAINLKYLPHLLLFPKKGDLSAIALADIGLLAASYGDGSLFVVDIRGPGVILRLDGKAKSRHSIGLHLGNPEVDAFVSMLWTVCSIESDPQPHLRLIAARPSGSSQLFTFEQRSDSSWKPTGEVTKIESLSHPLPGAMFVINSKTGARCLADRRRLSVSADGSTSVLFVVAGEKGARCHLNINGDRLGRTEWSSKVGQVLSTQIVEKLGSRALVAFTDRNEALAYSLPDLEFLYNLELPPIRRSLPITVDETGDFVAWTLHPECGLIQEATYGTMFDSRRVNSPSDVVFSTSKPISPTPPQPVSVAPESFFGAWFKFSSTMTAEQADILFGGPDRPIPKPQIPVDTAAPEDKNTPPARVAAAQATSTQNSLHNRLTSALEERGQMLGDLEDRFNSLEQGSRSMVNQAKRLAAEQTAKSWFKFG
ncbi:wd40 containing snare-dependent exocytosis protein [Moniliophthora roreri]|uniref:Lethal giant larvae (Lgl)-like C-terminal domain-containing protein n=1 Tax=Moniliophthora roreri TaxID=221103 RepID=A0A0W0F1L0_MONRR|nr:wd40 containing snare-dependent exocytosis protein [Moniliophthora roreri]